MTISASDLAQARAAQALIMTATGTVRAPGEGWAYDPATGGSVPATGDVIYTGPMRLQRVNQANSALAGGQALTVSTHVGAVPWDTTTLQPGCTITVTESDDPNLTTGAMFTITSVEKSTIVTARRFWADEVESQ